MRSFCEVTDILYFNQIWAILTDFQKKPPSSNSTKIRGVGAQFIHAEIDGQTDMSTLIGAFRASANTPKN